MNHWLDRNWKYQPAATHNNDSQAFRERMKEYAAAVKKEAEKKPKTLACIPRRIMP